MKKIAIVEDNPDNMLLAHTILEDDFEIAEYADGREALAGIRKNKPDLILLDISLPGMDGVEVLRHIRADETLSRLPVIAFSTHIMTEGREKFINLGFNDCISKPIIDKNLFSDAVKRCLMVEDEYS